MYQKIVELFFTCLNRCIFQAALGWHLAIVCEVFDHEHPIRNVSLITSGMYGPMPTLVMLWDQKKHSISMAGFRKKWTLKWKSAELLRAFPILVTVRAMPRNVHQNKTRGGLLSEQGKSCPQFNALPYLDQLVSAECCHDQLAAHKCFLPSCSLGTSEHLGYGFCDLG